MKCKTEQTATPTHNLVRHTVRAQTALQRLTRTSFKYTPGPSKPSQDSAEGLESAPLREVDLLMERMRRADELACFQTSFVHPLNFQETLVRAPPPVCARDSAPRGFASTEAVCLPEHATTPCQSPVHACELAGAQTGIVHPPDPWAFPRNAGPWQSKAKVQQDASATCCCPSVVCCRPLT